MSNSSRRSLASRWEILVLSILLLIPSGFALNTDGILLLSFKYAILSDPLAVLDSWNYDDVTPCSWNGVTCGHVGVRATGTPDFLRVTGLVLPNSKLLGSIPPELGQIEHLTSLDLSGNLFNGSLPDTIFNSSSLQVISLANNVISGELKAIASGLKSLRMLNISDNALAGTIPETISALKNLTVVSLRGNYLSGNVPGGFGSAQVLDLSSNLLNGSLPLDFAGAELRYLNLSYNKISGPIPTEFGSHIPKNATIDLSFNNLSGSVPESLTLFDQKAAFLAGNSDLCGKPLKILCSIPSTLSSPPNGSSTSPAIAVIPKPTDSSPDTSTGSPTNASMPNNTTGHGLKPGKIAAIAVGDLAGIGLLALVILYVYQTRKKKALLASDQKQNKLEKNSVSEVAVISNIVEPTKPVTSAWSCLTIKAEETSDATSTSDSDQEDTKNVIVNDQVNGAAVSKGGSLVTVDGETDLEMDTLLKASAYILGASGGSIVYKAVLEDGTAYAVRRIGENGVERLKEFESQVRAIARLKHQNLVRVRGFYWGEDDKLVIYDYVPNGSLGSTGFRKGASSPFNLTFETRLRIARGVARGMAYIHEKKHVHGNIKPSNILLSLDMEPVISDLGLDRLVIGTHSLKLGTGSTRQLGSWRFNSIIAREGQHDSPSPYTPVGSATSISVSPYQAPESLKNVKPNPKWDVYSYGIILLELLTGRVFMDPELSQWAVTVSSSSAEDRDRTLRIIDGALRADMGAKEEAMMACLKLGFSCASLVPQKRPSMKEVVQVLEKLPMQCML